jgi:hypothetical protein
MTRTRRTRAKKWPQRTGAEKVRTHVVVQNPACGVVGGPLLKKSARLLGLKKCRHGCAREPKKTKCLINHCNRLDDELNSDKSLISFIGILSVYGQLLPGGYIIPRYTDLY